jgi:O-antigen/teichoic acid export membrane protein
VTSFALWLVGLGGRSTALIVATLNVVVLARALGPLGRGQYFIFISFVLVLTALADLGMSQSAVVFTGRREVPMSRIHAVLLVFAPAVGFVVAAAALASLPLIADSVLAGLPRGWSIVALAVLPLSVYANYWTGMMVGARRIVEVNAVQFGTNALTLAANLTFVATTGDATAAVVVYVVILALQAATMFGLVPRTRDVADTGGGATALARRMVAFGVRAYPNTVSALLWARLAVFVLNVYHGPPAVGVYSVAQQLAERILLPIQAIQDVMYARMAQLTRADASALLNRYLRLTVTAMVPTVIVVLLVSPALVSFLFSDSFQRSTAPLRLLLIGSAVQAIPVLLAPFFIAQLRRPGLLSLLSWSNAALSVVLLLALVPGGAETGAAIAIVVTQIVGTLIAYGLYLRIARTDPRSSLVLRSEDVALVRQQALALIRR